MTQEELPLINELIRVIGYDNLLNHMIAQTDSNATEKVQVCSRVLIDEWNETPWTTVSINGDRLIQLYRPA